MDLKNRLLSIFAIVAGIIVFGSLGFTLIEGWSLFDSMYMTIITFSTVGYSETHDLSDSGRVFAAILILVSMVGVIGWTAGITGVIVSGDISGSFRRKREAKVISKMKGHTIICGDGMLARSAIDQLHRQGQTIVFVSDSEQEIERVRRQYPGLPIVQGAATSELALADANLLFASTVVAAQESDIDNLMISITCKSANEGSTVYSCAKDPEFARRMLKVGVNEVICPNELTGRYIASLASQTAKEPAANPLPSGNPLAGLAREFQS